MKQKIEFDVRVDCYSNGVAVRILNKKTKEKFNKVFCGKGHEKREANWVEKIISIK